MDNEKFTKAYNESRNGCNEFFRHSLARTFAFSDGVEQCADCGLHWFVDIVATEVPKVMRKVEETLVTVTLSAKSGVADISLTGSGDVVLPWSRHIDMTDCPDGDWVFLVADDSSPETSDFRMILVSEY